MTGYFIHVFELFMTLEEALNSAMQQEWREPQRVDVPIWTSPEQYQGHHDKS